MMILADLTAGFCHSNGEATYDIYNKSSRINEGIIPVVGKTIGFEVADKYDSAKFWFCMSGVDSTLEKNPLRLGGMEHGHMAGTYYFLANDYEDKLRSKSASKIKSDGLLKNLDKIC